MVVVALDHGFMQHFKGILFGSFHPALKYIIPYQK